VLGRGSLCTDEDLLRDSCRGVGGGRGRGGGGGPGQEGQTLETDSVETDEEDRERQLWIRRWSLQFRRNMSVQAKWIRNN
jgi:hypothetical protein